MTPPWVYPAGALAVLAALVGSYAYGRHDGASIEQAAQARAERAAETERKRREGEVVQGETAGQVAEVERSTQTKEVYREIERVIPSDPVYINRCNAPDGVRELDRAVEIANGNDPGQPDGEAARGAEGPSQP